MAPPSSTYRLQVRPSWDLDAAASTCAHIAALGAGGVYLSPLLPSARGSEHGYDVVRFDTVDEQRGGREAWARTVRAAREHGLQIVVDIVPNHTGVADAAQNPAWWDVLRLGRDSPFARWFDIEWSRGRILLPVLGDDFTSDQLTVEDTAEFPIRLQAARSCTTSSIASRSRPAPARAPARRRRRCMNASTTNW